MKQLPRFVQAVFGVMQPKLLFMTTPNSDFNLDFPLVNSKFRHPDHKFEWSSNEFKRFCDGVCWNYNYTVTYDKYGPGLNGRYCTQVAIFSVPDLKYTKKKKKFDPNSLVPVVRRVFKNNYRKCCRPGGKFKNSRRENKLASDLVRPSQLEPVSDNAKDIDWVLNQILSMDLPPLNIYPMKIKDRKLRSQTKQKKSAFDENASPAQLINLKSDTNSQSSRFHAVSVPASCQPTLMAIHQKEFTNCFYTKKYVRVQDIVYHCASTLLQNELAHSVSDFVWCLDPNNVHYPFVNKLQKLDLDWDYESILPGFFTNSKRLITPLHKHRKSIGTIIVSPHNADRKDKACSSCDQTYKFLCMKCPFLYICKMYVETFEDIKPLTKKSWQNNVVYETPTTLWFSFSLVSRYLNTGDVNVDNALRLVVIMGQSTVHTFNVL